MRQTLLLPALCALAVLGLCAPNAALAADVALFPVESTNVPSGEADSIGQLFAQAYANVSRQAVLAPSRSATALEQAGSHAAAAAALSVEEYVRSNVVALGERHVFSAARHRQDGTLIFSTRMTADNLEDFLTVVDRMARALWLQQPHAEVRTHKNVTRHEGRKPNRVGHDNVIGFKSGLHMPFASDQSFIPSLSVKFDMRVERERYFLEWGAGFLVPTDFEEYDSCDWDETCVPKDDDEALGGLVAEIGGGLFLSDSNLGPYVSAGLLPRLNFARDEAAMLLGYVGTGLSFPRDSSTRFNLDLRLAQSATPLEFDGESGGKSYPTELSLHAGVGW